MKANVSKNNNLLSINIYKVNYRKILLLLDMLKVHNVSVFIDRSYEYRFKEVVLLKDLKKTLVQLKESILMFDGEVRECLMDKELEILSNRKILVNIDLGENMTYILLNIANDNISEKDIVKIIN